MDVLVRAVQLDLALGEAAHAGADGRGVLGPHAGVGDDHGVAASRSACCSTRVAEVRGAGLLLALDEELEVHGGGGAAGGGEVGPDAEGVEEHLALVVGRAARVEPAVPDRPARRGRCPSRPRGRRAARRGGRRRGRSERPGRRTATRRRPRAHPAVSQISVTGKPVSRELGGEPLGAAAHVAGVVRAGPDTEGMRSHSARSSRKAARCCSMYVTARRRCPGCAHGLEPIGPRWRPAAGAARRLRPGGAFQPGPVRQVVGADDLAAADVEEGGGDGVQRHAVLLGPGEPVDGASWSGVGACAGSGWSSSRRSRTSRRRPGRRSR